MIPAARTGSDTINNTDVSASDQTSNGVCKLSPEAIIIVVKKLMDDPILAAPLKCKAKIASSIAYDECTV